MPLAMAQMLQRTKSLCALGRPLPRPPLSTRAGSSLHASRARPMTASGGPPAAPSSARPSTSAASKPRSNALHPARRCRTARNARRRKTVVARGPATSATLGVLQAKSARLGALQAATLHSRAARALWFLLDAPPLLSEPPHLLDDPLLFEPPLRVPPPLSRARAPSPQCLPSGCSGCMV